jgi:hypothetical protein
MTEEPAREREDAAPLSPYDFEAVCRRGLEDDSGFVNRQPDAPEHPTQ